MDLDVEVSVVKDDALPALDTLRTGLSPKAIKRAVGTACVKLTQDHLRALPHNKMGWPPLGFYEEAARSCTWDETDDGVRIAADNESHPGSLRQRFHGGPIDAKDHLLTIPARQEFYGVKATDVDNLRFVPFASGAKALAVGKGGSGLVDFGQGKRHKQQGSASAEETVVAYWLKEHVDQDPDPSVLPTDDEYADEALEAVADLAAEAGVK